MSLTSILSAESIENAVKDCQGIISTGLNPQDQLINARRFYGIYKSRCWSNSDNVFILYCMSLK